MTDLKIIYLGPEVGFEAARAALGSGVEIVDVEPEFSLVRSNLKNADAILDASMRLRITPDLVSGGEKLKVISCATTGSDHVDRSIVSDHNIQVLTLKEDPDVLRNLTPAAEHSWALLMACARQLPQAVQHTSAGEWVREKFPGLMLRGKTIGIVGCGRIGLWMSRYASAFGMTVLGYDPHLEDFPDYIEKVAINDLVERADFVTVHVHLSDETRNLISGDLLSNFKQGSIFIHTSRGGIVDETALLEQLKSGRIGSAALDVLEGEPNIAEHPLVVYARSHSNLLITPHCAGFSPDAVKIVCEHAALKIANHLERQN